MLILLRILVTGSWFGCFIMAARCAGTTSGDLAALGYMVIGILLSIAMSAVWTPWLADFLCGSLNVLDDCTYIESKSRLNSMIDWASRRRLYSFVVLLCLLKGYLRPELPSTFLRGLKHSKSGSWLQRIFARRVYRFNNSQNSLRAAKVLQEQGENPGMHQNPEVVLLMLQEKRKKLEKTQRIRIPAPRRPLLSDTTTQLPSMG